MRILLKLKYLILLIPFLLLVFLAVKVILPRLNRGLAPGMKKVSLTYWGLFEPEEVIKPLIATYKEKYESENPGSEITIKYEQRFYDSLEQYKETLLNRLQSKTGPDLMRLHITWLPQFYEKELASLPDSVMSSAEFNKSFYPVAVENATIRNKTYAIPLMYEGLVLLVNTDVVEEAGLAVPRLGDRLTWGEFRELAVKLTEREAGKISLSGAAIGLSTNIPHASDILGLMWAQSDVLGVSDLGKPDAQIVLDFYADFAREDKVWDTSFDSSIKAFAQGAVAMIFAPSWRILQLEDLNPGLNFSAIPVPQIPGKEDVTWASFWVESVSQDSQFQEEAWEFLKFLSSSESQKSFYSLATQTRKFGEPYSQVDLATNLSSHKYLGPLLAEAPSARTWVITDASGNKPYVEIIEKAITSVAEGGKNSADVLQNAKETLEQLLIQNKATLP